MQQAVAQPVKSSGEHNVAEKCKGFELTNPQPIKKPNQNLRTYNIQGSMRNTMATTAW